MMPTNDTSMAGCEAPLQGLHGFLLSCAAKADNNRDAQVIRDWAREITALPPVPEVRRSEWQWVPAEPTKAMQDACLALVDLTTGDPEDHRYSDGRETADGLYRAMLKAAPSALAAPCAALDAREQDIPDVMVDAYLKAQRETVERVDREWGGKTGKAAEYLQPVREACRNGLRAALASRQEAPEASAQPQYRFREEQPDGTFIDVDPTETLSTATVAQPVEACTSCKGSGIGATPVGGEHDGGQSTSWIESECSDCKGSGAAQPCASQGCGEAGSAAVRDVLAERQRQTHVEGFTPEHDDEHANGSMAIAAACYALVDVNRARPGALSPLFLWRFTGWAESWWKPKGRRHNLVRSAALTIAEIERLDRAALSTDKSGGA